ncbi:capping complex subunit for YIEGIA [Cohnella silvisoli]|uniref:Uncharacterized protein n=1 Tax=Cohnella silvisoli TaxID=2873699 RepID=A0ABV1KPS9_9BACL|nr:hypothetical protein [Cohnella silvisoli]MCD9021224.1 hypothetical protein [Cohnella silvisoli]
MAKIVGIITTDHGSVGGGSPIFYARDRDDLQKVAHLLEKVLDCAAHEVHEDLFIVVDRHNNR